MITPQTRLPLAESAGTLGGLPGHSLSSPVDSMSRFAFAVARFSTSAWVGAAVLFVLNGVQQVTSGKFESMVTDQLVLLRFPTYYVLGFSLVGAAFIGSAISGEALSIRRRGAVLGLLGLALVLMLFDYLVVYLPLAKMIDPPGQPRPDGFCTLHRWSMIINTVDVGFVMLGAVLLNWPHKVATDEKISFENPNQSADK